MADILHIDKDAAVIAHYRPVLEKAGHTVISAASAQEARQCLETARPDIIIMEVMLEETTTGFELFKEFNAKYPAIPVIMLTNVYYAMTEQWRDDLDRDKSWLPVYRFMEKPVSSLVLVEEVEHVLEEAGHAVHA
ncbi:MAG: response regulator [Elusimicrobiaceae bacterium]|nr:response regulator [Elusimicrobiaceae bacterium]